MRQPTKKTFIKWPSGQVAKWPSGCALWLNLTVLFVCVTWRPSSAHADILGGLTDIVHGAVSLPMGILMGTLTGPPVIGTVQGALAGSVNTLSYTARGVLGLAGTAVPAAMALAPYLPLIL